MRRVVPISRRFLAEHVDAFLPQKQTGGGEKKGKRTNARASEREISGGEFFSGRTQAICIHDAPDSFFADQIRGEIVALLARSSRGSPFRAIDILWKLINYIASTDSEETFGIMLRREEEKKDFHKIIQL